MPSFKEWLEEKKNNGMECYSFNNENIIKFLDNLKELLFPSQSYCSEAISDYLDLKLSLIKYY